MYSLFFFFQAEDGIRDLVRSRGLGDVYKRQVSTQSTGVTRDPMASQLVPSFGPRVNAEEILFRRYKSSNVLKYNVGGQFSGGTIVALEPSTNTLIVRGGDRTDGIPVDCRREASLNKYSVGVATPTWTAAGWRQISPVALDPLASSVYFDLLPVEPSPTPRFYNPSHDDKSDESEDDDEDNRTDASGPTVSSNSSSPRSTRKKKKKDRGLGAAIKIEDEPVSRYTEISLDQVDPCLLYTSDAADEEDSVDLGGRRIINKKNHT
eukprot:TRINITY_DN10904_c0_g1_i1.p1 TRINITY_DN10904_c0_g1~~TRINITY_DN10904_c0_g1_i1.p1  ORF type:complete len:264 (+),score=51.41 TRINITY_DN10904_c0_g1_i1:39-830(+)